MIHYVIQILAFQLLFLIVYDLFLKKETFFNWNRVYLLFTPLLSLFLPFVQLTVIQNNIPETYTIQLPEILIGGTAPEHFINGGTLDMVLIQTQYTSLWTILYGIWILGMLASLSFFIYKLFHIKSLRASGEHKKLGKTKLVILPNSDTAFSFFNTLFLGDQLSLEQQEHIVLHERIHIEERHSLDLLFFEVLRIIFWFNPLVYVFQNKMVVLQEYTADAKVVAQKDKLSYYQELLSQAFQTQNISFINTFFNHSLIKKRIIMLQKSKSSQLAKAKYLYLLPVVLGMLFYTACTTESLNAQEANPNSEVLKNIAILKESIAKKGNLSDEEARELKGLALLVTPGAFENELFDDVVEFAEIPFAVIEKVPTYPGCSGSNDELKKCMSDKISKHVNGEFNMGIADELELQGVNRIYTAFKIDSNGNIVDIKVRAPHEELKKETERVIKTLPRMKPGEQKGKPVGVLYSLPITFQISKSKE